MQIDHRALKWLMDFKNPQGQTARWNDHQEGPEEDEEEYHCATAVKVIQDPVAEKDPETSRSAWLLPLTDVERKPKDFYLSVLR